MCRIDVVGLAECLLGNLPVGADDLGDMGFDTAVFKIPNFKLFFDSTKEIAQRFTILVGVMNTNPAQVSTAHSGKLKSCS